MVANLLHLKKSYAYRLLAPPTRPSMRTHAEQRTGGKTKTEKEKEYGMNKKIRNRKRKIIKKSSEPGVPQRG
jgi:hypothetical protein